MAWRPTWPSSTLDLPDDSSEGRDLLARTEGVTASFVRELVRRAVLARLSCTGPGERVRLTGADLLAALDGLQAQALSGSVEGERNTTAVNP